jgi:hypothetical protein
VLGRVVLVVVDSQNHCEVLALGRGADDDLFGPAAVDVGLGLGRLCEDAGGLDDQLGPDRLPGDLPGILQGEVLDLLPVDDETVALDLHGSGKPAVVGVVFEKVGVGFGVEKIVHRHDFQFVRVALENGLENLAADAAETVDTNVDGHKSLL